MICKFRGKNWFLSNFYPVFVVLDGKEYSSVEHAYQASKSLDLSVREQIRCCGTPSKAKKIGKTVRLRPDWENIKESIMLELLRQKFGYREIFLRQKLLETKNEELVEGNTWGDKEWGVFKGDGKNKLGKLLMRVRAELQTNIG